MKFTTLLLALASCLALSACTGPNAKTKTGAGIGAATGAVIGYLVDDGIGGVLVGGAIGAAAGGVIGNKMDNQQAEMEEALAQERATHAIEIKRLQDETLKIEINSEVSFDSGESTLKPTIRPAMAKITQILRKYPDTNITVVGHTDSKGGDEYNMNLSQRRAYTVSNYFSDQGIATSRLTAYGRGESLPRATNDTPSGRALNRRVEIFVKPKTTEVS